MTIEEMVKRYSLVLCSDGERVAVQNDYMMKKDNALEMIKERKAELLAFLKAEKEQERLAYEERRAKINAIEGLEEIRNAKADLDLWHSEFSKSFDGDYAVGGLGVREKPHYDFEAMYEKYPVAVSFLKAEEYAEKTNARLSAIGQRALDAIIENPTSHEEIIKKMNEELDKFTNDHLFD